MDQTFWQERWNTNNIGFHQAQVHPLLAAHADRLPPAPGSRVFVPLCGKTLDIHWLLARGYRVAGAELSPIAVEQLFAELGIPARTTTIGPLVRYSAEHIDIFLGDIFDLSAPTLGAVDAVYDRAALVALPRAMRERYAAHLTTLTRSAPQLLLSFDYDQSAMEGPPFSVSGNEIHALYEARFSIDPIDTRSVSGGLRGQTPATETMYVLRPTPSTPET